MSTDYYHSINTNISCQTPMKPFLHCNKYLHSNIAHFLLMCSTNYNSYLISDLNNHFKLYYVIHNVVCHHHHHHHHKTALTWCKHSSASGHVTESVWCMLSECQKVWENRWVFNAMMQRKALMWRSLLGRSKPGGNNRKYTVSQCTLILSYRHQRISIFCPLRASVLATECYTRSSAIAGRPCDAKACQG